MLSCPTIETAVSASNDDQILVLHLEGAVAQGRNERFDKKVTRVHPTLSLARSPAQLTPEQKYIAVTLDLDGPFPSFSPLSPILHCLQGDMTIVPSSQTGSVEVSPASPPHIIADWRPANPPPIGGAHRYLFLLYQQPNDFSLESSVGITKGQMMGLSSRVRWDLKGWEEQAGVKGKLVASNVILCS